MSRYLPLVMGVCGKITVWECDAAGCRVAARPRRGAAHCGVMLEDACFACASSWWLRLAGQLKATRRVYWLFWHTVWLTTR